MRKRRTHLKDKKAGPAKDPPSERRKPSRLRKWLTRLAAAILAPAIFLLLLELGLRGSGYGYDTAYFIKGPRRGVYLSNPRFGWRFFGRVLSRPPIPTVLPERKPEGTYRIFVFGGSAAAGEPKWTFSFARLLEAMLNDRFPPARFDGAHHKRFEVVNTGMVAINSHVALAIARDCAAFEGDLYIVYMGNNEVVGPYGAGTVIKGFSPSLAAIRAGIRLRGTRVGQLLGATVRAFGTQGAEKERAWGGLEMFVENRVPADDPRLQSVYAHFRANLEGICDAARDAGAAVILSTVVTNLKDCPPFASVHRADLSAADASRWDRLYQAGKELQQSGDPERAATRYRLAAKIDPRFAELHFRLGRCCLAMGRPADARKDLVRARDLDALRFRADSTINETIRRVARDRKDRGVHLVDAARTVASGDPGAPDIPGATLLYEHVHLTFEGNYALAAAIFRKVVPLLPADVRAKAPGEPEPLSPDRCARRVLFSVAHRFLTAQAAAGIVSRAPFTERQHTEMLARTAALGAQLTSAKLASIAETYRQAMARRPDDLAMRANFAHLLLRLDRHGAAEEQFGALLDRYPYSWAWRYELGMLHGKRRNWPEAIEQFRQAVALQPGHLNSICALANALIQDRQMTPAAEQYRRALTLWPDWGPALSGLARIRAAAPQAALRDGPEAVRLAERACAIGKGPPALLLDTLGAAYAENGQFEKAVAAATEAMTLAERAGKTDLARDIEKRLALYHARTPFRLRWGTAP